MVIQSSENSYEARDARPLSTEPSINITIAPHLTSRYGRLAMRSALSVMHLNGLQLPRGERSG